MIGFNESVDSNPPFCWLGGSTPFPEGSNSQIQLGAEQLHRGLTKQWLGIWILFMLFSRACVHIHTHRVIRGMDKDSM
jgi:hypothetical protein